MPVTDSGEDLVSHVAGYVDQADISACVAIGQLFVVESHQSQPHGVQAIFVSSSKSKTFFHARPG